MVNARPQGLAVVNRRGTLLYTNEMAAGILKTGQTPCSPIFEIIPELQSFIHTGHPEYAEIRPDNGGVFLAKFSRLDGEREKDAALVTICNRADMERTCDLPPRLAGREAAVLEAIVTSSYDGLWLIDHTGTVVLINHGAERIYRLKKEDVIGKSIEELLQMKVIDRSVTHEVFKHRKSLTINQKSPRIDKEILVTANPAFDESGALRYVVIVDRDVTELNRLRREIEETHTIRERLNSGLPVSLEGGSLVENGIINSESMKNVYQQAIKAAQSDSTILLMGESGVGKGFLVRLIHDASPRKNAAFVHLDCGAVPVSLIDSELFGYESGAFTGARREGKAGFLEAADNGTLFLDEVSELPISAQVKLLRFLDSNEFVRVGGIVTRKSNARIIAATNRDLDKMVRDGEFRKDLYFRLNVVPIQIPPLRERREAIPRMIQYFLDVMNTRNRTKRVIDRKAMDLLCSYNYPGNVRELINLVEQLVVLSAEDTVTVEDLPQHLLLEVSPLAAWTGSRGWNLKNAIDELEREMILQALKRFGSQRNASDYLGIDQSTLARKAKKHGIRWKMILHRDE